MHSENFKDQVVVPLQSALFRLASSLLRDRQEAEDIVQEILMRLWLRKDSLKDLRSIKAFALKMVRNLCLDKIKLRKQQASEAEKEALLAANHNPHELAEIKDMMTVMRSIIDMLPEKEKTVIHLKNIEELSFEEIAEITDMNINHVRVTLSRARKNINEIYLKRFNNE